MAVSLAATADQPAIRKQPSLLKRLMRHRLAAIGLVLILIIAAGAIFVPWLSPYDVDAMKLQDARQTPTLEHPLGTDKLGRDNLTRVLAGGRISLFVALASVTISTVIGTSLGLIAGYSGGWIDTIISRIADIFMSFPLFVLLIVMVSMIGPSITNIVFIIGAFGWMMVTRLVRGQVISLRNEAYIEAAQSLGAPTSRILVRHILPNTVAPIVVSATLGVAGAMLTEAALSFLGLGIQPPTASWGNMLNAAQSLQVLVNEPWTWLGPGLAITLSVLSINFIGDGLRDALDPRSRQ